MPSQRARDAFRFVFESPNIAHALDVNKDIPEDRYKDAIPVTPAPKQLLSLRLDADIIAWFRAQGPGYQTRMNAVLRTYMAAITRR